MTSARRNRPIAALSAATLAAGLVLTVNPFAGPDLANAQAPCAAPADTFEFVNHYIDEDRAGGEPIIVTHPDGQLLWGSHAGTTHFYSPTVVDDTSAAFVQNYQGQTYQYYSEDGGETWTFSPRSAIGGSVTSGVPNSGFSDPEFAIDSVGNVFISEINLANIAFSKSTDGGRSYELMNVIGISASDRQWMEADEEDVIWFVANTFGGGSPTAGEPVTGSTSNRLYKSTDGGANFSVGQSMGGQQSSEIVVDKTTGALYQIHEANGEIRMRVFADARSQTPPNVTYTDYTIMANHSDASSIGPTPAIDANGNLYVTWDEDGGGVPAGIYYSYSTDGGQSWAEAIRLDSGNEFAHWPWVAVGDEGGVAVTWLEHDGPASAASRATEKWDVHVAISQTGLGCDESEVAGFTAVNATPGDDEYVHIGTICDSGTTCQAFAVDRRLGDYFANTVTKDGKVVIAVSDTRQGGSVSLPLAIRQVAGPTLTGFRAAAGNSAAADAVVTPLAQQLPTTGGGMALLGLGLAGTAFAARRRG